MVDKAVEEMTLVTGQKAVKTLSTKDVSNFKLRKHMPIGCRVTLRRENMYDFLDRLITVTLPRTRDFQGIKAKGFDGRGNFTFGIKEQLVFPEIVIDDVKNINGMDITIVTSANTDEEAKALLSEFGFPFKKLREMAKESMKARERKRAKMVAKYAAKRAALKEAGDWEGLQKLPPNSSAVRMHNRCQITGRPRGYMRQFGISRVLFRKLALAGRIPGVKRQAGKLPLNLKKRTDMHCDPLADFLTRIRNAQMAQHKVV